MYYCYSLYFLLHPFPRPPPHLHLHHYAHLNCYSLSPRLRNRCPWKKILYPSYCSNFYFPRKTVVEGPKWILNCSPKGGSPPKGGRGYPSRRNLPTKLWRRRDPLHLPYRHHCHHRINGRSMGCP